jgi:hypothetical protein
MSLESIALPLAESRALVEHGIVLDTALVWMTVEIGEHNPMPPTLTINYHLKSMYPVYPGPVFSELLDAIDPAESSTKRMVALAHALEALHEEAAQNAD